jgi:hypothetical protein
VLGDALVEARPRIRNAPLAQERSIVHDAGERSADGVELCRTAEDDVARQMTQARCQRIDQQDQSGIEEHDSTAAVIEDVFDLRCEEGSTVWGTAPMPDTPK